MNKTSVRALRTVTLILVLFLSACSNPPRGSEDETVQAELASQEQALGSDESSEGSNPDDSGPARVLCPEQEIPYKLQFNHTFDFSPNRQTEIMRVTGQTTADAWCLVFISGTSVQADDCIVGYDYTGYIQGSDAKCDVSGSSTALISIEGECMPGVQGSEFAEIYLTIMETENPDGDISGALNCPGHSGTYIGFYPPTFFIATFPVTDTAAYDTDPGPDLTGQFEFSKNYSLTPSNAP
ncbi:MAG: hypothetical protein MUP44_01930 [Anaerolineales bacterium]|nr:hypothetical protein [Anaerolineales bacterium]